MEAQVVGHEHVVAGCGVDVADLLEERLFHQDAAREPGLEQRLEVRGVLHRGRADHGQPGLGFLKRRLNVREGREGAFPVSGDAGHLVAHGLKQARVARADGAVADDQGVHELAAFFAHAEMHVVVAVGLVEILFAADVHPVLVDGEGRRGLVPGP